MTNILSWFRQSVVRNRLRALLLSIDQSVLVDKVDEVLSGNETIHQWMSETERRSLAQWIAMRVVETLTQRLAEVAKK